MRPLRSLPAALLLGALSISGAARAQDIQYRSTFGAALQWTDNVQFVPDNPPNPQGLSRAALPYPKQGFTANITPAVLTTYETPRTLSELQYTFNFTTAIGAGGNQFNYLNRLEGRTRYDVSDLTVSNFALRLTQGQQTIFPDPPPGQAVTVTVPGTFGFGTVEIAEGVNHRLSPDVAATQAFGANMFYPIDATPPRPTVFAANLAAAIQYNDDPDNYGVNLTAQVAGAADIECTPNPVLNSCGAGRTCAVATHRCVIDSTVAEPQRKLLEAKTNVPQLASRLAGTYRHDFKNGFLSEIDLGVQQVMRITDGGGQNWQPVGRLALRYDEIDGNIGLTLNHGMQLNLELGGIVLADNADLLGTIPIDRETRNLVLQLQAGYQRGTLLDAAGALLPGFQLFAGDVALAYRPQRWLPNLGFALRYQFRYQINEPTQADPLETHRLRNAVLFNINFEYPERQAGK